MDPIGTIIVALGPVVPALLSLVNDPEPRIREALTNSLPYIDADAAAKAGLPRRQ